MADKKTSTIRRIALVILAVFSALLAAGAVYLSFVPLDLSGYHASIESMIESGTGRRVTVERIVIKALPSPDLTLGGLKVYDREGEIFGARSLRVKVSLIPLVAKTFNIKALEVSGAELFIKRDEAGAFNIIRFMAPEKKKAKKARFHVKSLALNDSKVRFIDLFVPGEPVYEIKNIRASLSESAKGFKYGVDGVLRPDTRISLSGTGGEKDPALDGTGAVTGLSLVELEPYLKKLSADASLKGTVNAEFAYTLGERVSMAGSVFYRDLEAGYPAAVDSKINSKSGSASVSYLWKGEKDGIEFSAENLKLFLDGFSVNGSFRLFGPEGQRMIALQASSTAMPFASVKDFVPVKKMPPAAAKKFADLTPVGGRLTVRGVSLSGPLEEIRKKGVLGSPDYLSAQVLLEGLKFRYGGLRETFSDISGGLTLKDGALAAAGISGSYGKQRVESLRGRLWDLTGKLNYALSVDGRFDARQAVETAAELTKNSSPELSKKLSRAAASGSMELKMNLSGALKDKTPPMYSGRSSVTDGSFAYEGFPVSVAALKGGLAFDNRKILLRDLSASDTHSAVTVNGRIENYRQKNPSFDLSAAGELSWESLRPFFKGKPLEKLAVQGRAPFSAAAGGFKDYFDAGIKLDATASRIEYKRLIKKAQQFPMTFDGSVTVNGKELTIRKADLDFGKSTMGIKGSSFTDRAVYDVSVTSRMKLADLGNISPFLTGDFESDGLVALNLSAQRGERAKRTSFEGEMIIREGRFKSPYIEKPVERIDAQASFNDNKANIILDNLSVGHSEISGWVEVSDISKRELKFSFFSPMLHLEDIIPMEKKEKRPADHDEKGPADHINGTGEIRVREGTAWGHRFKDFSTDVQLIKDAVYFTPLGFSIDNGTVLGGVTFYRGSQNPLVFDSDISISNVDLETMFSGFRLKAKVLSGKMNGKAAVSARRGVEPFSRGLNGRISLSSEKGRLWKFPVLASIFSIVNIFSIDELFKEGLPYKSLNGDFSIEDGVISTTDFVFDSDSLRMSATGKISLPDSSIDSTLAMHPFVTIDKVISNIPLAGWIITGKEKSTVSMYFEVSGPLKKPDVSPRPIRSIEKGILGILQRIIEAPGRALSSED